MQITLGQLVVWLIVGALVGSIVGRLVRRRRRGFGWEGNIVIGTIGAIVGGILFDLFNIEIGQEIAITTTDLIAAFVGSFLVLILIWAIRR